MGNTGSRNQVWRMTARIWPPTDPLTGPPYRLTPASACLYRFFRSVEVRQTTAWNGPHLRLALSYNSGIPNETSGFFLC
jgi:hypothetical protein